MHLINHVQCLLKNYQRHQQSKLSFSVLKSKVNNTSYVNSQLSKPCSSKISTGPKVKPSILTIKKLSQFTYQKNSNKISEDTGDSDVSHPASISDENDECSTSLSNSNYLMWANKC